MIECWSDLILIKNQPNSMRNLRPRNSLQRPVRYQDGADAPPPPFDPERWVPNADDLKVYKYWEQLREDRRAAKRKQVRPLRRAEVDAQETLKELTELRSLYKSEPANPRSEAA